MADIDSVIIVDDNEDIRNVAIEPLLKGDPGITPTIGVNGNWYLGETDTGKPSRGADGTNGTNRY